VTYTKEFLGGKKTPYLSHFEEKKVEITVFTLKALACHPRCHALSTIGNSQLFNIMSDNI